MERTRKPPKYLIRAHIEVEGKVRESDVVGAIFGQTGEVIEDDLNLRILQEKGIMGRINVGLKTVDDRTEGWISIPTSLGREETAQIGATLETLDKVGKHNAKVEIDRIRSAREAKRKYLRERAGEIVEQMEEKEIKAVKNETISRRFEVRKLSNVMDDLKGSMKAVFLNRELRKIGETDVGNVRDEMKSLEGVKAVVFDGVVTQAVADLARQLGIEYLVGVQKRLKKEPKTVKIFTSKDLDLRKGNAEK